MKLAQYAIEVRGARRGSGGMGAWPSSRRGAIAERVIGSKHADKYAIIMYEW